MFELFTLLYISTAAADIQSADVASITRVSRERNAVRGITGLLAYDGESFVQWLEGDRSELSNLLQALRRDGRHGDIEVLAFEPCRGPRRHQGWDLGYHLVDDESDALDRFRPLRGGAALQDFQRLAQGLDVGVGKAVPG